MVQSTLLSFSDISEVYLQELRRGNAVKPELLANRFPQFAEQILEELPLMAMLEKGLQVSGTGSVRLPRVPGIDLIGPVGRGATGVVYKAKNRQRNTVCAVKLISLNPENVDPVRLDREIETLTRLKHPHVVEIQSFGMIEDSIYIVMNFVDGCSLDEVVAGDGATLAAYWSGELRRDWCRLGDWGYEIASALDYIHQKGILHRDIKPANLLVDQTGRCWITDFGLAKICETGMTVSRTGQVIGTPRFMAPEQMRGTTDRRSDIYSLGRTLYELAVAGADKRHNLSSIDLPPIKEVNPDFPTELAKIIDKASQPLADRRYQSAGELSVVLERYLSGIRPSDRRRPGKRLTEQQYKKRMRIKHRIAIACSTIAMSAAATFFATRESPPPPKLRPQAELNDPSSQSHFKVLAAALEDNEQGFVGVIGEALKTSMIQKSDTASAADVTNKIDQIVNRLSTEGLKPGELDSIMRGYRESSLLIGNKVLALRPVLKRSGLGFQEKARGERIIGQLAKATVNRKIETTEAERILSSLFQGNTPRLDEIISTQIPDRVLASWLTLVESSFATEFEAIAAEPSRYNDEWENIIDTYFQASD
ncbi:serine/threonine protein kinase [Neorhodopirellula pilleata]|uniref:non-specific serine/threonine protein kinase n=1 Tax=Neorhodopirellula pilleata TaxID=2714738 RepID=A0A5C5ZZX8_9BACT|nr:serine/threonine-protein kinase [Neorhodopirellula pilleata]TWT93122.1 Serine/threonine-protein kinase PknB [Neorhodopirellula pilleata]